MWENYIDWANYYQQLLLHPNFAILQKVNLQDYQRIIEQLQKINRLMRDYYQSKDKIIQPLFVEEICKSVDALSHVARARTTPNFNITLHEFYQSIYFFVSLAKKCFPFMSLPLELRAHVARNLPTARDVKYLQATCSQLLLDTNLTNIANNKTPHGTCLATLKGHRSEINSLAILENNCLISISNDYTMKCWDMQRGGLCYQTLKGKTGAIYSLAILPNDLLANGSYRTINFWQIRTSECRSILNAHQTSINALIAIPQGRLASGGADKIIKIWSLQTSECIAILIGHESTVNALNISLDSNLISVSADNTIKLWNLQTFECINTLRGHKDWIYTLLNLPDGRLATGSKDKTIKLWNLKNGEYQTLNGHSDAIFALALLSDNILVSAGGKHEKYGELKFWDLRTNNCLNTLRGHHDIIYALAKLSNNRLASGSGDSTIKIWHISKCLYG